MLTLGELLDQLGLESGFADEQRDRTIRAAHTSELLDPTPWLSGGEVVLTTGINLLTEDAQRRFIANLDEHRLAACGLGIGFDHHSIPAAMRAEAQSRRFPVFEVPYEMPFIAITEVVFKIVVGERAMVLERGVAVHELLEDIVLRDRGLDAVIEAIGEAISGAAYLIDATGTVSNRPKRGRLSGADLAALRAAISAHGAADSIAPVLPNQGPLAGRVIAVPIPGALTNSGSWLAVIPGSGQVGELDRLIARHGAAVVALEYGRERAIRETERRLAGDVLADALGGRLDPDELQGRLRPFNLGSEIVVAVFTGRVATGAEATLAEILTARGYPNLVALTTNPGSSAQPLLCAVIGTAGAVDPVALVGPLRDALADSVPALRAAASRVVALTSIRRAFHEARCALEATSFGDEPPPQVASHRDLGAFTLLLALQDEEALRAYSDGLLAAILTSDDDYGPELLRSVEAFIEENGHWERAAKRLYCHRHTLRYRIRKVEELTGRDLGNARDRIELWMAIRARELLR